MQNSEKIWQLVDARKDAYEALSDRVWGMPEIAYTEYRSVAEHKAMLEQEGFRITENVAGIPTAVMGEAGDGGPVIAILGEYDALPGLSQVAGIARAAGGRARRPRAWLRPQPARLGGAARRDRGEELSRRGRHQGARALLRLPGRGRRRRQGLHGARRLLRGRRHRDHLAPRGDQPGRRRAEPRGRAGRLHVPRPRLACGGGAASRPQRARRGRADECRRQLHARAHAVGRAHPLRDARRRRRRAERRAGLRQGALLDPRARACPA